MPIRKLGPCRTCSHWRDPASLMLASSRAQHGQCRRRVQTGTDGLHLQQPETQAGVECSEHMPLPASEHLAQCCGDCSYWKPLNLERHGGSDEGLCQVWAPRWSSTGPGHAFPIVRRDFYCGDGASVSYVDPDDDEDA